MLMAIIEFEINTGAEGEIGRLMDGLMAQIEKIDGYISSDPASSLKHEGLMYEVSYWRDAEALAAWARDPLHLEAMQAGRDGLFKWYRIRIAEVTRDWSAGSIPAGSPAAG